MGKVSIDKPVGRVGKQVAFEKIYQLNKFAHSIFVYSKITCIENNSCRGAKYCYIYDWRQNLFFAHPTKLKLQRIIIKHGRNYNF